MHYSAQVSRVINIGYFQAELMFVLKEGDVQKQGSRAVH